MKLTRLLMFFFHFRLCIVNEETNHIHVYIMATPIKLELIRLTRTIYLQQTQNVLSKLNNHTHHANQCIIPRSIPQPIDGWQQDVCRGKFSIKVVTPKPCKECCCYSCFSTLFYFNLLFLRLSSLKIKTFLCFSKILYSFQFTIIKSNSTICLIICSIRAFKKNLKINLYCFFSKYFIHYANIYYATHCEYQ